MGCSDVSEGGINKCLFCELDGEKAICKQCVYGYILLTNNNSCLEIMTNKELEKFEKCNQIRMNSNNIFECIKCKERFTLININNKNECIYIRTLYDYKFKQNFEINFNLNKAESNYVELLKFEKDDFIYNKYINFYPCQEAENLGTKENPLYSCIKCYENPDITNANYINPVKIYDKNSKLNYCLNPKEIDELKNCKEATYLIKNGKGEYSCTECIKNYVLIFNKYSSTFFCQFSNDRNKCLILYCKTCNTHDGYTCEECFPNYEKNILTGECVKKTEVIPAITWKDIYRLKMNGVKFIGNRYFIGPILRLRGVTSSQINSRHAFLIYLTLAIKNTVRNLQGEEEKIRISSICQVIEGVDETSDNINLVEYKCIGNQSKNLEINNYKLDNIEEGNNEKILKRTNLNELVSKIKSELFDLQKLEDIIESSFTLDKLLKIVIFQMRDKIENITANDYKFKFTIYGSLNKDLNQTGIIIEKQFDLFEIDNKAECLFMIKINKTAELNCNLNVEKYKNIKTFSFKTSEIKTGDYDIYFAKLNDIILINNNEIKNKSNEVKIIIIVICLTVGLLIIGIIIIVIMKKRLNSTNNNKINNNNELADKNSVQTNDISDNKINSEKRMNQIENKY